MESIVTIDANNIQEEHICCAFSDKKCRDGYEAKKEWLKSQFDNGFVFKKLDVRGKVFIEYIPAEYAWVPVDAPETMMINCFWVSGQYKGLGNGKRLLDECKKDSKGKNGIVAVSSEKKQPFLSDPGFYKKYGFEVVDTAEPYFKLWYLRLEKDAHAPRFKECAKQGICDHKEGLSVYYTNGCPFTQYYVKELEKVATKKGHKIRSVKIETMEQAQNHFVPYTNYTLFRDGRFITQQILSEKSFDRFIS